MPNFAADSVDMTMKKSNLYIIAALIWGIPGAIISVKGILAYLQMAPAKLWWRRSGSSATALRKP